MDDIFPMLLQFSGMCARLAQRKPFVFRSRDTLSLHFDPLTVQSEMRCDAPEELVLPYTRTMMGFLLLHSRPRRIAMIGLGGGSLAKYCYAKLPEAAITVTEIDPEVLALRNVFHIPPDDARFAVHCADGAEFVRDAHERFDVLLVDGFDRGGQPSQLCSQHFYDDCYRSLAPEGILVANLVVEDPFLERSVQRIRHRFGSVIVVDSEDRTNRIAFASKGMMLCLPDEELFARLNRLEPHHPVDLRDTLQRIRYEQFRRPPAADVR